MGKLQYWGSGGITKMTSEKDEEKYVFKVWGIYLFGNNLGRLEWAVQTIDNCHELVPFLAKFRMYEDVKGFEDIGREARKLHDEISNLGRQEIPDDIRNQLHHVITRWATLMEERLQDLYLVTPQSIVDAKCLMEGIEGVLNKGYASLLQEIERSDLNEGCKCILVGSPTAGEHITLRVAESLLRRWYEHKTGETMRRGTWGSVLDKLVKLYPENERPKELSLLGYLKQRRDEVAHPDRISELSEAETTLMNVCSLIKGIVPTLSTSDVTVQSEVPLLSSQTEDKETKSE